MQGLSLNSPVAQAPQSATQPIPMGSAEQPQPNGIHPATGLIVDGALLLVPLSFALIWAIVVLLVADLPKLTWNNLKLNRTPKVPCRNCRYFSSNPYLKCAIHPTVALTDNATDCKDFQAQEVATPTRH